MLPCGAVNFSHFSGLFLYWLLIFRKNWSPNIDENDFGVMIYNYKKLQKLHFGDNSMLDVNKQLSLIKRNTAEIIPEKELARKIKLE